MKQDTDQLRAHVVVQGFVQGIWFRASTKDEANRVGVTGWVRNLPDGSVEAVFEGKKKNVEVIVNWCHRGPSGAKVDKVEIAWEQFTSEFGDFEVRYGR